MKILPVDKIREADAYTIKNEPIKSIDLMERAAGELYSWFTSNVDKDYSVKIFAGPGNNGGDGLALARMLFFDFYNVSVYIVRFTNKTSEDFNINFNRLSEIENEFKDKNNINTISINNITTISDFPEINKNDVIIDAIFGSGLTRAVKGFPGEIIDKINQADVIKISIDIPSGLFADKSSIKEENHIIKADYTLSFQFPKLSFLMPENDIFVGEWHVLDIGLLPDYINSVNTDNFFFTTNDAKLLIKPRLKYSHKGSYGHGLLIAGSYGKMGAAVLASEASLRSGIGLLHIHIPKVGYQILQTAVPEAMISLDRYENYFSEIPDLSRYNAIGIGPGLGMEHQSQMALKVLIQEYNNPIVFDADALNILSKNPTWLHFIPPGSIFTPHPKEFERLAGKWNDDFEKIELQREFAKKYHIFLVLKGAHTSICTPEGKCLFNSTGNPGMATAGSGDVLTGIITALLAQKYSPEHAAVLGVFIHGLAGDYAADKLSQQAMLAGDITKMLAEAFKRINN
jgi:NAD(P)H-hydrate epimerase